MGCNICIALQWNGSDRGTAMKWLETDYYCMYCGQQTVYHKKKTGWSFSYQPELLVCIFCRKITGIDTTNTWYVGSEEEWIDEIRQIYGV